LSLYL